MPADRIDSVVSLAKGRGFVYPSSEIDGGSRSAWDYGPLGVELKDNVRRQWWRTMVQQRDDIVGLDSAVILARQVWEASGHIDAFVDPLTECTKCHKRFRADHLEEAFLAKKPDAEFKLSELNCPNCGNKGTFTEPKMFNGLMKTYLGATEDEGGLHYLRPETAQGIFVNYRNVETTARMKPPFGIAQIGKSFRNEITPGNFIFRTLEFEQMEMEFFVPPAEAEQWHEHWMQQRMAWYVALGVDPDKLRLRPHEADELSHYSSATSDIEYLFPIGWSELEGIANRGDFDLRQHAEHSGQKLEYVDTATGERYVPHVVEPAAGVGRTVLALLCDAYDEDEIGGERRTVLRLQPSMAPVKVAVLPLVNKAGMPELARSVYEDLRGRLPAEYDAGGSIGKRYRRQDEIGTPFGVTVDGQSTEDSTVTLRDRDTLEQERVPIAELGDELERRLAGR